MKWYKRDPLRWYEGTRELPLDVRGFYADCIELYIHRDGDLRDDDRWLARAIGCDIRTTRRIKAFLICCNKIRPTVDGKLVPNGCEVSLNEARSFSEVQATRGEKRWKNNTTNKAKTVKPLTTTTTEEEEEAIVASSSSSSVDRRARATPVDNPAGSLASAANDGALAPPPATEQPTFPPMPPEQPVPEPPRPKLPPVQNLDNLLAQSQIIRQAAKKKGPPFT